ncbi:MAG: Asp-tRNA(Asn)/Glu-tRNA(Gln) amidotransferase subunit GatB [Erysipelotrichaceae bacterium]|jgi:aspartyl-tRNA(Asn)/glutamyl-tRNA(Gln) amidotransferase subunit B|nr:Asp-tRNA(Asn)/Glu-tRNA(Gln) amidotransferase subunit GatB [Erysipelotrichaceae bacterium]
MNFEAVIGLEIHVEMATKSKMFSSAPVSFGDLPNSDVALLDIAFPGTMPVVNRQAVINAIRVANALNMEIDNELWFDRKNYFYSDLPKGYQITQQRRPIGKNGYLIIKTPEGERKIEIERIHLEEDTCKQLHFSDYTLLDYNRAGVPLIEIVSRPDIKSGLEAMKYVEKIRSIVQYLDVSTGKMEEGSLRCDVNISIRPIGDKVLGTKVEIKNLNSLANVQEAIDFEVKRQKDLIESGEKVRQETRRFNEDTRETVLMRVKTDAVDYKYFVEPNITPIKLSDEFIAHAISTSNELADSKLERYLSSGLSEYDANIIISDKNVAKYFDEAFKTGANAKLLANWIIGDVQAVLNKEAISIGDFTISPNRLSELVKMIENNEISNKQARDVFIEMLDNETSPKDIAKTLGFVLNSNEGDILNIVLEVLNANEQSIIDYKNGKDRAVGFLMGQVMKISKGKANPSIASKILLEELKRR